MLLSFARFQVKPFQVKPINFDCMSKSIHYFWILQGSVTTQLKWGERQCNSNSYIDSFFWNLSMKEFGKWSTFTKVMIKSQVYCFYLTLHVSVWTLAVWAPGFWPSALNFHCLRPPDTYWSPNNFYIFVDPVIIVGWFKRWHVLSINFTVNQDYHGALLTQCNQTSRRAINRSPHLAINRR